MTMRATVERDGATGTDGFGMPNAASWASHIASQACFLYISRKGEREIIDGTKTVVLASQKVLMPLGTDITENDRITSVKDRIGTVLAANTMRINSVVRRHNHIELSVTEVQ